MASTYTSMEFSSHQKYSLFVPCVVSIRISMMFSFLQKYTLFVPYGIYSYIHGMDITHSMMHIFLWRLLIWSCWCELLVCQNNTSYMHWPYQPHCVERNNVLGTVHKVLMNTVLFAAKFSPRSAATREKRKEKRNTKIVIVSFSLWLAYFRILLGSNLGLLYTIIHSVTRISFVKFNTTAQLISHASSDLFNALTFE